MRAFVCHELSPDRSGLRFNTDWPEPPAPGPNQVTLKITASALNYPDLLMLSGGYQFRPNLPYIPGTEGCGIVIAAGQGTEALLGQRMIITARQGLLADRITVPVAAVRPAPPALSDAEAAAFTVGALTAWVGLVVRGRLCPGERVLITGAGGGTGLAAVALAKLHGAHVIAVASSPERLAAAAGADEHLLIDRGNPQIPLRNIDLVFDPVGGPLTMPALKSLGRGGRYAIIGFTAGQAPPLSLNRVLLKEIEVIGVRAGEHGRQNPQAGAEAMAAIDAHALKPYIGLCLPLTEAPKGFAAMASATLTGKATLIP
jgi:NADPH2:quinone reductase